MSEKPNSTPPLTAEDVRQLIAEAGDSIRQTILDELSPAMRHSTQPPEPPPQYGVFARPTSLFGAPTPPQPPPYFRGGGAEPSAPPPANLGDTAAPRSLDELKWAHWLASLGALAPPPDAAAALYPSLATVAALNSNTPANPVVQSAPAPNTAVVAQKAANPPPPPASTTDRNAQSPESFNWCCFVWFCCTIAALMALICVLFVMHEQQRYRYG